MTIARLQQFISLSVVGLAAAWVLTCLAHGRPQAAWWALLVLVPHALILGIETLWASQAARRPMARRALGSSADDETARVAYPSVVTWIRAWAREVLHSLRVFGWQQPWRHQAEPDFLPQQDAARVPTRGQRGVVLVHGFVCNRGFWNTWMRPLRQAGVPHVAVTLSPPFGDIAQQAQAVTQACRTLRDLTGVPPLLVGHSMGGLVLRTWLAALPDEEALAHELITIGSPHHGTALAQFAQSEAAQQMQLLSPFIQDLAAKETPERRSRMTCYWSVCDNIVFPASTATLPGAHNRHLGGHPHVGLSQAPEILQDVLGRTA